MRFKKKMSKSLAILLAAMMILQLLPVVALAVGGPTGNWSDNANAVLDTDYTIDGDTYTIKTAMGLAWLAQEVNGGNGFDGKTIELENDLDLSAHYWTPVGNGSSGIFQGIFDGKGYKILSLYIGTEGEPSTLKYVGLFGFVYSGTVKNLGIENAVIYADSAGLTTDIGILAGYNMMGTIDNCYTTGDILAGDDVEYVGGLVGKNEKTIANSYSAANVTVGSRATSKLPIAGGLVGYNTSEIINSYATGNVTVGSGFEASGNEYTTQAGGLAGQAAYGSEIKNSFATGDVTGGQYSDVGGLFGKWNTNSLNAENIYWNSDAVHTVNDETLASASKKGYGSMIGSGSDISVAKTMNEMKHQDFVDLLNQNIEDLPEITGISYMNWKDINDGFPIHTTPAPALTVTVAPGAAKGSVKAIISDAGTTSIKVNITDSEVSTPDAGDPVPFPLVSLNYTSGTDITDGVAAGKYIQIYDATIDGFVIKFYQQQLTEEDITQGGSYVGADGNTYTYTDNGDGTATISGFTLSASTDIVIPETVGDSPGLNVAAIDNGGVFMGQGLTSASIPSTVTTIGDNAFINNSLTSITIPDNVTNIANDAFRGNSISSVVFGSNLTTIGNGIFADNQLTSITIPARFTSIGGYAFQDNLLTEVTIENAAANISFGAFIGNQDDDPSALTIQGYTGSTAESYADENEHTFAALDSGGGGDIVDGMAEDDNGNYYEYDDNGNGTATITYFELDGSSDIEIPGTVDGLSVTAIGDSAFEDCGITSLIIPDTVTSIGEYAFADNGLTSATIQNGVISIGDGAFAYNQLESVTIPDSVTSIGGEAFSYNLLESISIGDSVESIGDYAFAVNRLTSVTIENSTVTLGDDIFAENQDDDPTVLTIHGYTGSTADDYADIYGYTFVALDGGSGTDDPIEGTDYIVDGDTYTLKTAIGLVWFSTQVNNGDDFSGKTIELEGDMDLAGTDWMPIGSSDNLFNGSFDGKSYKISNLTIAAEDKSEVGFFGVIGAAGAANNIILEDITITAASNHDLLIGGIAGANMGSIANSHITTSADGESIVSASGDFLAAGGITGFNLGNISESSNSATIEVGGGNGKPSYNAGGIAATNFGAIDNSFNTGTIRDTGGTADAYVKLGGIAGRNNFMDQEGQIHFTYNTGEISLSTSSDDKVKAGIAGYSKDASKITDNFFLEGTAEYGFALDQGTEEITPSSEGAAPKTEAELMDPATFAGWDNNKWVFTDGSMPILKGLAPAPSPAYTVIYDGNGSTGGTVPADGNSYEEGDTVTVLGNTGSLVKTGYTFNGWNNQANGEGMDYVADDTFTMGAEDVTLYAKWTAGSTADASNNTVIINPDSVTAGGSVTITATGDRQTVAGAVYGEERYIPANWSSTETGKSGTFALNGGSYTSTYTTATAGSYTITVTFRKQTWDGEEWVDSGDTDTKTATLTVNEPGDFTLSVEPDDSRAELSWDTVTDSVYYSIYTDNSLTATVTDSVYGYDVMNLTNGRTYSFEVKALDGSEVVIATSNKVSATPRTVPEAPNNVKAVAGNGKATITFTAPTDDGGSPITGYIVTSNPGNITATGTGTGTTITVTGLTNGTTYTFTVKAVNEVGNGPESAASNAVKPYKPSSGGSSGGSSTPSTPTTPEPTEPGETGIEILVNGKTETAATATTTKVDDKTVTTVVVDDKKVEEKLKQEGNNVVITIPVKNDADVVVGTLNGQTIKNMENKEAVLAIQTEKVTYTLPASQINIDAVSEQIGKQVELKDIAVSVKISEPAEDTVKIVEDTANKNNYQVVVKPVEFEITCSSGNKTVEVSKFNAYVERMVAIPEGIDPAKITTGIVLNPDGTFSHVPTVITMIDGKYYAKINSLTNSIYSVIWNPKTFKDVENHWAKDAVNDMGSRLVISGVGEDRFEPDREITRAEFAVIVVRALGLMRPGTEKDAFNDVPKDAWYYNAVSTAYEYGIISGYGDGKFGPNDKISREQAMAMIARAMKITELKVEFKDGEEDKLLKSFGDTDKSADYARNSIAACIKAGILSGRNDNLIAPKDNITRAEVAAIVRRLLQKSNLI